MRYRASALPKRPRRSLPLFDADGLIRLSVPASVDHRDLAVRVVAAACRFVGFCGPGVLSRSAPPEFENEVTSAFGTAFDQVADEGPIDLEIEIEVARDAITIRLRDQVGVAFAVSGVVQSAMDDVTYYRSGVFNVLAMTKRLR